MKRFTSTLLALTFILSIASFASACDHVAPAVGGYCANCAAQYNQAVGAVGYSASSANAYTKTTVTETVVQPATSGLQVTSEYVQPTTTILAPAPAPVVAATQPGFIVGAYQPPVYATGYYSSSFGAGGYGGYGSFGSFRGNNYGNSFGVVNIGHQNFRNFGAGNHHGNFRSGGNSVVVINANNARAFNAHGQQLGGNGRVQALPRVRNAVNSLRGR